MAGSECAWQTVGAQQLLRGREVLGLGSSSRQEALEGSHERELWVGMSGGGRGGMWWVGEKDRRAQSGKRRQ